MSDSSGVPSDLAPVLVDTITCEGGKKVGVLTLNTPKTINALTREMVDILIDQIEVWAADQNLACVLLRGSGDKGLCAGGDVVALRDSSLAKDGKAEAFFEKEYRLDYLIHSYPKPIVAWGHGIVMGGGLGLLAGASHRVVTAKTRLAMPEVTIGLYPDVGGSWFLNRMPGGTGLFLALTGTSIRAGDTLYLSMGDYFLEHTQWDELVTTLSNMQWQGEAENHDKVSGVLQGLSAAAGPIPESLVEQHFDTIQSMTNADSFIDVVKNIVSYDGNDEWLLGAAKTLKHGCPTSVAVTYEQLRRSKDYSLEEVFQMELVISSNCMRSPNFPEGVRALLVDKDRNPTFSPSTLDELTAEHIESYFEYSWPQGNPLQDLT